MRTEAVPSSQIEGTQSSLTDLLLHEHAATPGVPFDDVNEVSSYVAAMNRGIELLAQLPLSSRVLKDVHAVLLASGRGAARAPGEFRRVQNWIGGKSPVDAVFVPPPPQQVPDAMSDLEKFLHDGEVPVLVRAGVAHAQFETIHPFLDGNGRIGRMLIVLMFLAEGVLAQPLLYLSLHFKRYRKVYYELLQAIRTKGAWEPWLEFFAAGVAAVSDDAVRKMQELLSLFARDRSRVSGARSGGSTFQQAALKWNLDVFDHLRMKVAVSISDTAAACGSTKPTIARALDELVRIGIAREATGKQRNRVFVYDEYLKILDRES